jgi:hypothetical protein
MDYRALNHSRLVARARTAPESWNRDAAHSRDTKNLPRAHGANGVRVVGGIWGFRAAWFWRLD